MQRWNDLICMTQGSFDIKPDSPLPPLQCTAAVQCSAAVHCTALHSHHIPLSLSTNLGRPGKLREEARGHIVQCNAVQCSAVQCSTVQCSAGRIGQIYACVVTVTARNRKNQSSLIQLSASSNIMHLYQTRYLKPFPSITAL
jgi:hypothetical protein